MPQADSAEESVPSALFDSCADGEGALDSVAEGVVNPEGVMGGDGVADKEPAGAVTETEAVKHEDALWEAHKEGAAETLTLGVAEEHEVVVLVPVREPEPDAVPDAVPEPLPVADKHRVALELPVEEPELDV